MIVAPSPALKRVVAGDPPPGSVLYEPMRVGLDGFNPGPAKLSERTSHPCSTLEIS